MKLNFDWGDPRFVRRMMMIGATSSYVLPAALILILLGLTSESPFENEFFLECFKLGVLYLVSMVILYVGNTGPALWSLLRWLLSLAIHINIIIFVQSSIEISLINLVLIPEFFVVGLLFWGCLLYIKQLRQGQQTQRESQT